MDGDCGMDLVDGDEIRAGKNRLDRSFAVFGDRVGIVTAAVTHIQPPRFAFGNATASTEEAVRNAVETGGAKDVKAVQSFSRMMRSSSACSPTMKVYGPTTSNP